MKSWTIRVDEALATKITLLAEVEGKTLQKLVVELLEERAAQTADDPRMLAHARAKVAAMAKAYGLEDYGENGEGR